MLFRSQLTLTVDAKLQAAQTHLLLRADPVDQPLNLLLQQLVELGVGLAMFHGFSKLLIALGCEPEQMDVSIHRTPGS